MTQMLQYQVSKKLLLKYKNVKWKTIIAEQPKHKKRSHKKHVVKSEESEVSDESEVSEVSEVSGIQKIMQ